jgi:hypothetical protein
MMKQLFTTTWILLVATTLFTACKKESVEQAAQPSTTLVAPATNSVIALDQAMQTITFRWTPLVPKPKDQVIYRLRVWQLMQGQNANTAMKENQPIADKSTDATSIDVQRMLTGPCKPPYLCDFVWNVTVSERDAAGAVKEIVVSSSSNFSIN